MSKRIMTLSFAHAEVAAIRDSLAHATPPGTYTMLDEPPHHTRRELIDEVMRQNPDGIIVRTHNHGMYSGLDIARYLREEGYQGAILTAFYPMMPELLAEANRKSETEELRLEQTLGRIDGYINENMIFYRDFARDLELALDRREARLARADKSRPVIPLLVLGNDAHMLADVRKAFGEHGRTSYHITGYTLDSLRKGQFLNQDTIDYAKGAIIDTYDQGSDAPSIQSAIAQAERLRVRGMTGPIVLVTQHTDDDETSQRLLKDALQKKVVSAHFRQADLRYHPNVVVRPMEGLLEEAAKSRKLDLAGSVSGKVLIATESTMADKLEATLREEEAHGHHLSSRRLSSLTNVGAEQAQLLVVHVPEQPAALQEIGQALKKARDQGFKGRVLAIHDYIPRASSGDSTYKAQLRHMQKSGWVNELLGDEVLHSSYGSALGETITRLVAERALEEQRAEHYEASRLFRRLESMPDSERHWPEAMRLRDDELNDVRRAVDAVANAPQHYSWENRLAFDEKPFEDALQRAYVSALEPLLRQKKNTQTGEHRWDEKAGAPRAITEQEKAQTKAEAAAFREQALKSSADKEYHYYDRMTARLDAFTHKRYYVTIPADPLASVRYSKADRQRYPNIGQERVETQYVQIDKNFPYVQQAGHGQVLDFKTALTEAQEQVKQGGEVFGDQGTYDAAVNQQLARRIVDMLAAVKRLDGDLATQRPSLEAQVVLALEGRGKLPMRLEPTAVEKALREKEVTELDAKTQRGGGLDGRMTQAWVERAAGELGIEARVKRTQR